MADDPVSRDVRLGPRARFSDSTHALLSMCIFKLEQSFVFVTL